MITLKHFLLRLQIALTLVLIHAAAPAQQIDSLVVACSYEQVPLREVIRDLETRYPINFYYKEEWIPASTFTGHHEAIGLAELVDLLVYGTGLEPIIIRNGIYLAPRFEVLAALGQATSQLHGNGAGANGYAVVIGNPHEAGMHKRFQVRGKVRDGKDGTTLIGATVRVMNESIYAVTGFDGDFTLDLTPGSYEIVISSLGFEEKKLEVRAVGPGRLDVDLFESSHEISEVRIYAQRHDENVRGNQMSMVELDARSIKMLPLIAGERDIVKSFTMSAGVKSVGEFGAGMNVRGGGEDQNLYLLEGSPLFNTSHVMGLLSVINPDAVTNVALYKGHIPADFGERVSSVMTIQMRDYSIDQPNIRGGIGIFSSRLLVETPVLTDRVTLKVGGRASYSDYLLSLVPDFNLQNSSAGFYDLFGVMNINLNKNPITISAYNSSNSFQYTDIFSNQYANTLGSISWSHIFSPDFSSNLTTAYSNYQVERHETSEELFAYRVNSQIEYLSSKLKFRYTGFNNHTIDIGAQTVRYSIDPGVRTPLENSWITQQITSSELGNEYSAFINNVWDIGLNTSMQLGLRYTQYYYIGPHTIYSYLDGQPRLPVYVVDSTVFAQGDIINQYGAFEPRFSFRQVINDYSSVKLSYNRNAQYLSLLSYSSISTPEDTWKLADPFLKPVIANQFAIGYYRNFANNMYETSIEAYYKQLDNLVEYRNGAILALNNHVETELLDAIGYNYGIELMVRKNSGKLNGTITYTYSQSLKQTLGESRVDQINRNELYPSQFDKPHDLNVSLNYNYNRRIRFGANFSYNTGRPITLPEFVYNSSGNQLVYFSDRNKYRLPDYHRLDLSVSVDENLRRRRMWKGSWTFSLLNVYGRKNAYTVFYKRDVPNQVNNYRLFSLYKLYLIGTPLPTVTYNFIF